MKQTGSGSVLGILDELGIRHVTDKSSLDHDYLDYYQRIFAPFRDQPITLLEIGVFDGGSLLTWEEFFPRATIVGVDIRQECKRFEGGRRIVEIASQADAEAMRALGSRYKPSIIIDDGSHMADHIMISFEALFPSLVPGGLYIAEDLAMHSGSSAARMRGTAPESPQSYFLRLANWATCPDDVAVDIQKFGQIESIEFKYCLATIKKKSYRGDGRIEDRKLLVDKVNSATNFAWFSRYIVNNQGNLDLALEYARKAVDRDQTASLYHLQLSSVLEHMGRIHEACSAAQEAARLNSHWQVHVDRLRAKLNG